MQVSNPRVKDIVYFYTIKNVDTMFAQCLSPEAKPAEELIILATIT